MWIYEGEIVLEKLDILLQLSERWRKREQGVFFVFILVRILALSPTSSPQIS